MRQVFSGCSLLTRAQAEHTLIMLLSAANLDPSKKFSPRRDNGLYSNSSIQVTFSSDMEHKVVLVTGSSSGIGQATAERFAKLGCMVTVHGTDINRLKQVAARCDELSPKGLKCLALQADLRDPRGPELLIEKTIERYGRLDVLVNNAGLFQPVSVDHEDAYKIFQNQIRINLDSVVQLTILAVPHLRSSKGCIVNISSNLHSKCIDGGFAYCTAKAGLTMFTKSIAVDLAPDVRVNSVSPGPVATLMPTRCGMDVDTYRKLVGSACLVDRVGEADEIARLVVFLASDESSFITGSDYIIDGGSSIKPEGKTMNDNK